jgi:hypothetical protein
MVVNAIFNNISVISWQSVLLVQETGVTVSLNVSEFLVPMDRYSVVNVREFLAVEPLLLTFKKKNC